MNKRPIIVTFAAAMLIALTGCGASSEINGAAAEAPVETQEPVEKVEVDPVEQSTPTPTPSEELSVRGNLVGAVGDTGSLANAAGTELVTFTVTGISPVTCTDELAEPPENGHLVGVGIDIETAPELANEDMSLYLSGHSFKFISKSGTTFNGELATRATYGCLPEAEILSGEIGPGEKVTGKILLDVPEESGTLVFEPVYGEGFEYKL